MACREHARGLAVNDVRIGTRSDAQLAAAIRPVFIHMAEHDGRFVAISFATPGSP